MLQLQFLLTRSRSLLPLWAWWTVMSYCAWAVIASSIALHVDAQPPTARDWSQHQALSAEGRERLRRAEADLQDIQRDIEKYVATHAITATAIESRLTRLETYNETNRYLLLGIMGIVAPIGLKAILELVHMRHKPPA